MMMCFVGPLSVGEKKSVGTPIFTCLPVCLPTQTHLSFLDASLFIVQCIFSVDGSKKQSYLTFPLISQVLGNSRVYFQGACDGCLPQVVAMISYERLTPAPSLLIIAMLSIVFLCFFDVFVLINYYGLVSCLMIFGQLASTCAADLKCQFHKKYFLIIKRRDSDCSRHFMRSSVPAN